MFEKVALLGMPAYGGPTMAAARAFFRARANPSTLKLTYQQASLLDSNCCALWAQALNLSRAGRAPTYFAMLHADVQPPDFWLDTLIAELEDRQLDVLSAVVPIKDQHGLTSTALGGGSDDPWRCHCRLTLADVYRLPETFTAADCGHPGRPLLFNTGCFVCRFDERWARYCSFSSQTRIVFDEGEGRYLVEAEPEDWHFARDCHRQGLRIACTRKLSLSHRGYLDYANDRPWGDFDYDRQYLDAPSVLPVGVDSDGWRYPADVEGWLGEEEARCLADYARGKRVLEVGSYCGKSTISMAQTAKHVTAVDPFDGRGTPAPRDTLAEFERNLARYGIDNVTTLLGTLDGLAWDDTLAYDLVFIDGAHDYPSVLADARHARALLAPGGLLAFHDYRRASGDYDGRWDAGVTRAVEELLGRGGELLTLAGTVAVIRPPATIPGLCLEEERTHG